MRKRQLLGGVVFQIVDIGAWVLLANAQEDSDVPMVSPDQADDWLTRHDLVLCYEAPDGQAYVYPFKIMNFHEIVNEEFDGVSVLSTTPTW